MEVTADQAELFPVIIQQAQTERPKSALRQFLDALSTHGPLVPRGYLPALLDLSNERVRQLVDAGRIATLDLGGRQMVPVAAIEAFLAQERKTGRPVREHTFREAFRIGTSKEFLKKS